MKTLLRKASATVFFLPAILSLGALHVYRKTLSPDHGPLRHLFPYGYCRHEPTCSSYALEVLRKKPYPLAVYLIVRRVASCNPWTKPTDEKLKSVISKL